MEYAIKNSMHWQKLVRFVSLRFHGDDAEDLLQTAYLKLYERREKLNVQNSDAFLVRTAINAGIDEVRRRKHFDIPANDVMDSLSDAAPGQEDVLSARQQLMLVRKILSAMKPRTRDILLMHRLDGMPYREISKKLGITQSAVEKQIAKGMRELMSAMGKADA